MGRLMNSLGEGVTGQKFSSPPPLLGCSFSSGAEMLPLYTHVSPGPLLPSAPSKSSTQERVYTCLQGTKRGPLTTYVHKDPGHCLSALSSVLPVTLGAFPPANSLSAMPGCSRQWLLQAGDPRMTEAHSHTQRTVFLKVYVSPCHEAQKPHLLRLVPLHVNLRALVDSGCWRGPVYSCRCPLNSQCFGPFGMCSLLAAGNQPHHTQVLINIHSSHRWVKTG